MATFRELLGKTLQSGVIQIKDYDTKAKKEENGKSGNNSNSLLDIYMTQIFELYKNDYKKVRDGVLAFIKDDSVGLGREIEPQDPIEITKIQFISALFFIIGRNKNIDSGWYGNALNDEKEKIFKELVKYCKAKYPKFIAQVTNKQDKDDKLPEIIIK